MSIIAMGSGPAALGIGVSSLSPGVLGGVPPTTSDRREVIQLSPKGSSLVGQPGDSTLTRIEIGVADPQPDALLFRREAMRSGEYRIHLHAPATVASAAHAVTLFIDASERVHLLEQNGEDWEIRHPERTAVPYGKARRALAYRVRGLGSYRLVARDAALADDPDMPTAMSTLVRRGLWPWLVALLTLLACWSASYATHRWQQRRNR